MITLLGEPKSTQHCYKYTCRGGFASSYMSKECKALKEDYQWQAKTQWRGAPLAKAVGVTATFFFGTKRRQDIDNFNKLWMDALSGIVWHDDSQISILNIVKSYDKAKPRIELEVVKL